MTFYDHHQTHKPKSVPNGRSHKSLILAFIVIILTVTQTLFSWTLTTVVQWTNQYNASELIEWFCGCFFLPWIHDLYFIFQLQSFKSLDFYLSPKWTVKMKIVRKWSQWHSLHSDATSYARIFNYYFIQLPNPLNPPSFIQQIFNYRSVTMRREDQTFVLVFLSIWNYIQVLWPVFCVFPVLPNISIWQIPNHSQGIGSMSYRIKSDSRWKSDITTSNVGWLS